MYRNVSMLELDAENPVFDTVVVARTMMRATVAVYVIYVSCLI